MSRLTAVLPLLLLLLGGCGTVPEPSADAEANLEPTAAQTVSPPSTVSQSVADKNGAPERSLDQDVGESNPDLTVDESKPEVAAPSSDETGTSDYLTATKLPESAPNDIVLETTDVVPDDTTIVPGERLGMVTLTTTYADLAEAFGGDRLSDTQVHLGEGFMTAATRVDLGEAYSFSVLWTDGDRISPLEIRELGPGWQTPEGIHYGMSFSQLQEILGNFELLGFGWDYGGTILLDNTVMADYSGKMFIRVGPSTTEWETKSEQLIKVSGDQAFSSTDPNFEGVDIEVYELIVRLNAF